MKKLSLILALLTILTSKAFADFGIGGKFTLDANEQTVMIGGGLSLGFGAKTGNAFILDVALEAPTNYPNSLFFKTSFDWHALRWNISIIQLYLGLGLGIGFEFDTHDSGFMDTSPFAFVLHGRIPFGVKVFLGSIELFLEVVPQLGWAHVSMDVYPEPEGWGSYRLSADDFHWAIGGNLGLRFWM